MCNAWNHSRGCNCGWGGVNYGTQGYRDLHSSNLEDITNNSATPKNAEVQEAKTSPTSCPWCGASVYYHTNGYSDSVYFDSLGYPWSIHECFKNYLETKKIGHERYNEDSSNHQVNFFNLNEDKQKRLVLIGIIRQIAKIRSFALLNYNMQIYNIAEKALAKEIKISIKELNENYGDLYIKHNDGGIEIISDRQLEELINIKRILNYLIN